MRDKALKIESDPKYDGYQRGLALMFYKFLEKKSNGSGVDAEPNYQLANELRKQIIKKFRGRKVYSSFRDNICDVGLAAMQSLSKYNKGIKFLLRTIDLLSKYVWVVTLKDKTGISVTDAFQKIISKGGEAESKRRHKPNKIWVDQGGELYNNLFKRFLKMNNIEMYSTYNEGNLLLLKDLFEH